MLLYEQRPERDVDHPADLMCDPVHGGTAIAMRSVDPPERGANQHRDRRSHHPRTMRNPYACPGEEIHLHDRSGEAGARRASADWPNVRSSSRSRHQRLRNAKRERTAGARATGWRRLSSNVATATPKRRPDGVRISHSR
jgi:hypothetical protein